MSYLIRFLILVLFFLFTSCSNFDNGDKVKIGFSQCISDHEWRQSMNQSMKLQASLHPEVDLTIYESHRDLEKQKGAIERMVGDGTDIIIVSPMEQDKMERSIAKAYEKGIPVILIDRKIESQNFTAYIGADNLEVGRNAGKYIASQNNGKANIIEIRGRDNSSSVMERSLGFNQIVRQEANLNLLGSISEGDLGLPRKEFSSFLDSLQNEKIDYVFASNDALAYQAWSIAKEKGLENSIKFIGVDGLNGPNGGIQLVQDGILEATILYPTGGNEVIELALNILQHKKVAKNNILTTTVIDKFNADIMKNQIDKIHQQQDEIEVQLAAIEKQEELYYAQNSVLKITMGLLAIILSLAIYSVYSIFIIRKKNRQLVINNKKITVQRNQIQKIAEEIKRTNETKLNFFTGVSHEFKTPLTLIMSSVESLSEIINEKGIKWMRSEFELINSNAQRLLRLINQLLDFRKIENNGTQLRVSKTNLYTFIKCAFNDFRQEAKRRNIEFDLECDDQELEIYIDRDQMDKVLHNLLSNAFKFTPDNGAIKLSIENTEDKELVRIRIKDTGMGIPKSDLKNVFNAFYQGSNNQLSGSGIGLHLCKRFVELHKGTILIESSHGTEVKVTLKKGCSHFNKNQIVEERDLVDTNIKDFESAYLDDSYLLVEPQENTEKHTILCIEDNKDLALFLKNKLMHDYDFHISDGTYALDISFDIIPDMILCDVNLPTQSGFEICEVLKNDLRTSHIPIVMLTALSDKASYIKGLQSGVDLFITKPFSYSVLSNSIKSLMYNREKLRYYYINDLYRVKQHRPDDLDHRFLNKLNSIIHENLEDTDFSIEKLAGQMNLSRVQLYRKVKAILGISVIDYVNKSKLKKGKHLLETSDLNVAEIAYRCGFSSSNYFARTFKSKYGQTPMDFRNSVVS